MSHLAQVPAYRAAIHGGIETRDSRCSAHPSGTPLATHPTQGRSRNPGFLDRAAEAFQPGETMRSILLWLLGVPIPIIILIALFWH